MLCSLLLETRQYIAHTHVKRLLCIGKRARAGMQSVHRAILQQLGQLRQPRGLLGAVRGHFFVHLVGFALAMALCAFQAVAEGQ